MDKPFEKLQEANRNQVTESINSTYDKLVVNKQNSTLPEGIFKEHFLPYFAGEKAITSDVSVMAEWVGVAGSPMGEVDVIDNNNQVLFTVPSLFDTNVINTVKRTPGKSLPEIYSQYDLRANNIPVVAEKFLSDALADKANNITKEANPKATNVDRWSNILSRYGYKTEQSSNSTSEEHQDDVVYD